MERITMEIIAKVPDTNIRKKYYDPKNYADLEDITARELKVTVNGFPAVIAKVYSINEVKR